MVNPKTTLHVLCVPIHLEVCSGKYSRSIKHQSPSNVLNAITMLTVIVESSQNIMLLNKYNVLMLLKIVILKYVSLSVLDLCQIWHLAPIFATLNGGMSWIVVSAYSNAGQSGNALLPPGGYWCETVLGKYQTKLWCKYTNPAQRCPQIQIRICKSSIQYSNLSNCIWIWIMDIWRPGRSLEDHLKENKKNLKHPNTKRPPPGGAYWARYSAHTALIKHIIF